MSTAGLAPWVTGKPSNQTWALAGTSSTARSKPWAVSAALMRSRAANARRRIIGTSPSAEMDVVTAQAA
jgi:hypothetical protein